MDTQVQGEVAARQIPAWAVDAVISAGRRMDQRGWVPATAGNISVRLDDRRVAITRSGGHKGYLEPSSVIEADLEGQVLNPPGAKPSAETLLHCQLYRLFPTVGAVLHGHSVAATVLSMALPDAAKLVIRGYEVQKAFDGQTTHDVALDLPIFDNDQDIRRLAAHIENHLPPLRLGYILRGHGVYIWGPDMPTALARLEGLEFLLACELERRRFAP